MTAKELIDAIEEHVGPDAFTDGLNGDGDALDTPIVIDLTHYGMGKRHAIDVVPAVGTAPLTLVVGEQV